MASASGSVGMGGALTGSQDRSENETYSLDLLNLKRADWAEQFCRHDINFTSKVAEDHTGPRNGISGDLAGANRAAEHRRCGQHEATHWTSAAIVRAVGLSASSIQRTWRAHGLQPHHVRQFKLSNDPEFVDKLRDIVGLYVEPPAHAVVLSVDEKSQIRALDRTQPGLPLK